MSEQLQNRLRDYYATQPTTGENPRIDDLTQLNSGWASDVYSFTLRYEEAGQTVGQNLVLKLYNDTSEGKDRALKERHALYNLRADRYPVPGVSAVEIDPAHVGRPFVIMEQIEGKLLWEALEEADDTRRGELIRLFIGLLVDLHALGAKILVPSMKPTSDYALVNREVYTLRGLMEQYERREFAPLVEWLYERRKSVPCTTPVVTHRDYHPWNVMLTEQGRPFVIDWGWQISDPRYDLAWTLTLMERSGFQTFRDEALAEYERVTGAPVEALDYFEVLAHTRWLIDVTNSLKFGINLRDGSEAARSEFRALISAWVRYAVDIIAGRTGIVLEADALLA